MWANFSEAREKDRTHAYLTLLRELSSHGEIFVPDLISPKDYADMIIHVEVFVKQDQGAKEGSALDHVRQFLATGELEDAIVASVAKRGDDEPIN